MYRATLMPIRTNVALGQSVQGRLPKEVECGMVDCVIRLTFTWSTFRHVPLNPKPKPNGQIQNIDVPTLDVWNIDVVEVDLTEQLTFYKSTV